MEGVGRIPIKINGVVCVAVHDVDLGAPTNVKQTVTADGTVIITSGTPKPKWSLKGVLLAQEQVFLSTFRKIKAAGQRVNLSFRLGTEEWMFVNCSPDNEQVTSNSDGEGTFSISGLAAERIQVS